MQFSYNKDAIVTAYGLGTTHLKSRTPISGFLHITHAVSRIEVGITGILESNCSGSCHIPMYLPMAFPLFKLLNYRQYCQTLDHVCATIIIHGCSNAPGPCSIHSTSGQCTFKNTMAMACEARSVFIFYVTQKKLTPDMVVVIVLHDARGHLRQAREGILERGASWPSTLR